MNFNRRSITSERSSATHCSSRSPEATRSKSGLRCGEDLCREMTDASRFHHADSNGSAQRHTRLPRAPPASSDTRPASFHLCSVLQRMAESALALTTPELAPTARANTALECAAPTYVLERRSQRTRVRWDRMVRLIARWLPPAIVCHPFPDARFRVHTQPLWPACCHCPLLRRPPRSMVRSRATSSRKPLSWGCNGSTRVTIEELSNNGPKCSNPCPRPPRIASFEKPSCSTSAGRGSWPTDIRTTGQRRMGSI